MEIIVHLRRAELSLVNDVGVGQGANVEARAEEKGVGGMFPEDVELTFKVLFVESSVGLGSRAVTVVGGENDDRLKDDGLPR